MTREEAILIEINIMLANGKNTTRLDYFGEEIFIVKNHKERYFAISETSLTVEELTEEVKISRMAAGHYHNEKERA